VLQRPRWRAPVAAPTLSRSPAGQGKTDAGVGRIQSYVSVCSSLSALGALCFTDSKPFRAGLALARLAGGDHLAIGRDQVEAVFAVEPCFSTSFAAMRPPRGRSLLARPVPTAPAQRIASARV
jgi:hypothetical protein